MTTPDFETILFIGGPADGERNILPLYVQSWAVRARMDLDAFMVYRSMNQEEPPVLLPDEVLYHKMYFRGRAKEHAMMVRGGMTADEVLERLMLYYRPPELDKESD